MRYFVISCIICFVLSGCKNEDKLPVLGIPTIVDGQEVPHKIRDFSFTNHNNETITNQDYEDKIYVADFFFTTCQTICPTVMSQMIRIYDKYEDNPNVMLLSHTLDPKKDTVAALKAYADNLEIDAPKWNLVTGDKKVIRGFAQDYMNIVVEDKEAQGGINHSGKIVLIDKERRVRAFAEGTDPNEVDDLLEAIDKLLKEYEQ